MKTFKFIAGVCLALFLFSMIGCTPANNPGPAQTTQNSNAAEASLQAALSNPNNPVVTITMESGEEIKLVLYPDLAPNTVKNFISLAQKGLYNGTIFHRVIPQFMIQGGDPQGTGMGGPGYGIKGEFSKNGFTNNLKHERGVLSMARSSAPDSAGSQFFIMVAATPSLDGSYAAFGQVTSGMETVDKIVNVKRDKNDKPQENQVMKSVIVDTHGVTYDEPVIIKK